MQAVIKAIEIHLPQRVLTNVDLAAEFPEWTPEKIESKTGIRNRHICAPDELASDLAVKAAERLWASGVCRPSEIDYILFCTQSPDFALPTTACIIQDRLGIQANTGAIDFNLGCSGFVAGLSLAKGLVETGQAQNVLLLTAETYTRHMDPKDFSVRTIFGDAGAATLVVGRENATPDQGPWLGPFVFGTDGRGADKLILRRGGLRSAITGGDAPLYMNGPDIFAFTLRTVPASVESLLAKSGLALGDIDLFVFHQANKFMLEALRRKVGIPAEKFFYALQDYGNTVSSTIPIALWQAAKDGRLGPGTRVMLVGFGVGFSWAATLVRWLGV